MGVKRKSRAPAKTGRMTRKGYTDVVAARRELLDYGYIDTHVKPWRPTKWVKGTNPPLAIQVIERPRGTPLYEIVEYPDDTMHTTWVQEGLICRQRRLDEEELLLPDGCVEGSEGPSGIHPTPTEDF